MSTTARDIDTKETARLVRSALRYQWPATAWSVRMDRGTAYGWLQVTWEDGPTQEQVTKTTKHFQSMQFDGMTDCYEILPDRLVSIVGHDMPQMVRYAVSGIAHSRRMGAAGYAAVAEQINAVQPDAARLRDNGSGLVAGWLTDEAAATLDVLPGPVDTECAAWRLHARTDLSPKS